MHRTELTLKNVRDIVCLLVCVEHQRNGMYEHKKAVERVWQSEFPHLNFDQATKSRYSLYASRSPTPSRTRPSTPRTPTRPAPSSRATDTVALLNTPDSLSNHGRHNRSASASDVPRIAQTSPRIEVHVPDSIESSTEEALSPPQVRSQRAVDTTSTINNMLNVAEDHPEVMTLQYPPVAAPSTSRGRSPSARRRASSSLEGFVAGEASSWTSWTAQAEVKALIFEPLPSPRTKGTIYIIQDLDEPEYVKIGITTRSFQARFAEIAHDQQRKLNEYNAEHLGGIPYIQLVRLEALVHADLARYQHNLHICHKGRQRIHREWFKVDMPTAIKTVRMWRDIMRNIRLEPGHELDPSLEGIINSSPFRDVDDASGRSASHEERIRMWTELLLARKAKGSFTVSSGTARWLTGCALIWLLPDLLGLPSKAAWLTRWAALAAWTGYRLCSH